MDINYKPLQECLACGANGNFLQLLLDLGSQPLANAFHDLQQEQRRFPLAVNRCLQCNHMQLSVAVEPKLLFDEYLYVSGTTTTLKKYFEDFVADIHPIDGQPLDILEIGCNDGTLLSLLQERGHRVIGVDPARNLRLLSQAKNLNVHVGYWSHELAEKHKNAFDIVIAQNVIAHVDNPKSFLANVATALRPDGIAYIQISQYLMLKNCEFDTIYHEHHSFFNLQSFALLAKQVGLTVVDAKLVPIHGTSAIWCLSRKYRPPTKRYVQLLDQEDFVSEEGFEHFRKQAQLFKQRFSKVISEHREKGYKVIAYGAAAKANTILNFMNISPDYIVDDNKLKIGLYSPGMNIRVVPSTQLAIEVQPLFIIIAAWNFADEIKQRIKAVRNNPSDIYFIYFPDFQTI